VIDAHYEIEEHADVLDLQAKYFGVLVFWFMYVPIILIDLNLIGILGKNETSQNIYIAGISGMILGLTSGFTILNYLMSGAKLLLTGAFGLGNFVAAYHPHEDEFEGWVRKVMLFSTQFQAPDMTLFVVENAVLREYRFRNYDRSPFHHVIEMIPVTVENKHLVAGQPGEGGFESVILQRIKKEMGPFIITTTQDDRDYFAGVFHHMSDQFWNAINVPSVSLISHKMAELRFPVRTYIDGLTIRHELSRRNILDTTNLKKQQIEVTANV